MTFCTLTLTGDSWQGTQPNCSMALQWLIQQKLVVYMLILSSCNGSSYKVLGRGLQMYQCMTELMLKHKLSKSSCGLQKLCLTLRIHIHIGAKFFRSPFWMTGLCTIQGLVGDIDIDSNWPVILHLCCSEGVSYAQGVS